MHATSYFLQASTANMLSLRLPSYQVQLYSENIKLKQSGTKGRDEIYQKQESNNWTVLKTNT